MISSSCIEFVNPGVFRRSAKDQVLVQVLAQELRTVVWVDRLTRILLLEGREGESKSEEQGAEHSWDWVQQCSQLGLKFICSRSRVQSIQRISLGPKRRNHMSSPLGRTTNPPQPRLTGEAFKAKEQAEAEAEAEREKGRRREGEVGGLGIVRMKIRTRRQKHTQASRNPLSSQPTPELRRSVYLFALRPTSRSFLLRSPCPLRVLRGAGMHLIRLYLHRLTDTSPKIRRRHTLAMTL